MRLFFAGMFALVLYIVIAFFPTQPDRSIPEPESSTDSLVVGQFSVQISGDIGSRSEVTMTNGIKLFFNNLSKNTQFEVVTAKNGFYHFLTNGFDRYVIYGIEYSKGPFRNSGPFYCQCDIPISASNKKVINMGHFSVLFAEMPRTSMSEGRKFAVSGRVDWDRPEMLRYIKRRKRNSTWLDYEIIDYRPATAEVCGTEIDG